MKKKIDRENVKRIIKMLDDLSLMIGNYHEMQTALFVWERYGSVCGIDEDQLNKINEILDNHETLFDEWLLEDVEEIVKPY